MVLAGACQPPGAAAHQDLPRNGNDQEKTGCSARRDGDFSGLQVLDKPLSRMLRQPAVLWRSAPGTLMDETLLLLRTRISVKNEVNAVSTGGEGSTGTTDSKSRLNFGFEKGPRQEAHTLACTEIPGNWCLPVLEKTALQTGKAFLKGTSFDISSIPLPWSTKWGWLRSSSGPAAPPRFAEF